jgi:hypothetical protein
LEEALSTLRKVPDSTSYYEWVHSASHPVLSCSIRSANRAFPLELVVVPEVSVAIA